MDASSLKVALSVAAVAAFSAMACSAVPDTDAVATEVDTDEVAPTACPTWRDCTKLRGGGIYNPPGGGGSQVDPGPSQAPGPGITCEGRTNTTSNSRWKVSTRNGTECLEVEPAVVRGGIPNGYSILSKYLCPVSYPVLHCNPYSYCTCWSS